MKPTYYVMKQVEAKLHEDVKSDVEDFIREPFDGVHWRGPSNPRSDVYDVPLGAYVLIWEAQHQWIWSANVSLGRTEMHTWFDFQKDRMVTGPGLFMVNIANYPCEVTDAEREAIIGDRNAVGRPLHARRTLHTIPARLGAAMLDRIIQGMAEHFVPPDLEEEA